LEAIRGAEITSIHTHSLVTTLYCVQQHRWCCRKTADGERL